jgi:hypothetical protein
MYYALARRGYDGVGAGLLSTTPERRPLKGLSWRDRGFSFISIRPAHLEFLQFVYGRDVPSIDEVIGRAMVDERCLPLGVVLVHFEAGGINKLHAHFGRWLRIYPKDILRGMAQVADQLREHEVFILHAIADEAVEGSDYLLKWLGAEPTGQRDPIGPMYRLDLRRCKI